MARRGSSPLARGLLGDVDVEHGVLGIIPARAGFTSGALWGLPSCGDHPRSRGVYQAVAVRSASPTGSSPLARGLPIPLTAECGRGGIIPARAGFTKSRSRARRPCADHPRSRGVYLLPLQLAHEAEGSSPLARGLRQRQGANDEAGGIIPARAGFTPRPGPAASTQADHPRSRGVYAHAGQRRPHAVGIIPARAGFTHTLFPVQMPSWDHPRSRGVYGRSLRRGGVTTGSSPLARGLRSQLLQRSHNQRIIPARAGFTLADPWNPNDEPHYQTAFAFTADLVLAPQSSDSAVVSQRSTRTPSEA